MTRKSFIIVAATSAALTALGSITDRETAISIPAADIGMSVCAVIKAQEAAWNRGDIDGYMNGYAHSKKTIFVSGDKVTRGWQTVRDRYKKKYDTREKMGTLTLSELEVTPLSGEAALVLGRWSLKRKADNPHGRFTLLFRRTSEGWRIVLDHTSAAEK
ncbi:MAG: nuclear transport factor 2 family protein [Verrucomicrobiota bacterium]